MRNEKLITAREEREWTQEKAAEKIGLSRALQRVLSLRQQLQPWSAVQDVKEVDEQLRRLNRSYT